jgi:peptidoglycan/xylan/chitin deacetylase (PgdA/CDA1 family)
MSDAVQHALPRQVGLSRPTWPDGAQVAVALTFDVDAEAGVLGDGPEYRTRLTSLSEGRYGVVRGVDRILAALDELDICGTFYVPGDTAERHSDVVRRIYDAGHEIAHHGHVHLPSTALDSDAQRDEIERGLAALGSVAPARVRGYRSPCWELTPETLSLVEEHFDYDSSLMGDDRPYLVSERSPLVELPVHWSLDDWPLFAWSPTAGGSIRRATDVADLWMDEFDNAVEEGRLMTLTMHPEVTGRGMRVGLIRELATRMRSAADVWFATHSQAVDCLRRPAE